MRIQIHRTRSPVWLCAAWLTCACGGSKEPNIGEQAGAAIHDTQLMRAATAAVNEALANAADCEVAKPLVAQAQQKLDELEPQVATTTGRVALDALRSQLGRVAQACP
jgi:hypothetical protein